MSLFRHRLLSLLMAYAIDICHKEAADKGAAQQRVADTSSQRASSCTSAGTCDLSRNPFSGAGSATMRTIAVRSGPMAGASTPAIIARVVAVRRGTPSYQPISTGRYPAPDQRWRCGEGRFSYEARGFVCTSRRAQGIKAARE